MQYLHGASLCVVVDATTTERVHLQEVAGANRIATGTASPQQQCRHGIIRSGLGALTRQKRCGVSETGRRTCLQLLGAKLARHHAEDVVVVAGVPVTAHNHLQW